MKILVDTDGVLADTMTEWLRRYNNDYDDNLKVEQITEWATDKFVKPECGTKIYDYLYDRDLYNNVFPIDGASSSVKWLKNHGHEVVFVTSGVQESKAVWLSNYGFTSGYWMFAPELIVAHHKYHIKGDLIIDDNPKNCDEFGGRAILFNQPWNESAQTNHFRAYGWPDVIEHISKGF